ncbi:hypothetical protein AvCA_26550 [Azotobacter vinelandii CA]|uniref:Uncharacterized protein n=2 Tax=Azotobacter vinelandii TaxID=354 RepID=C1DJR2_AZOVD|nr:DUF4150 domain-containing protein [Azotobacter vinelandii]ACO78831.1 hypothetical protein Avin_26550 [Azotobacter vinelandii DJ]AGK16595.1 hypothetical protein AvCA_26550 [Azotobacter vinelandii CA]AGK20783.1 hypothetical protein AvCA6_26550 [Azotobacter vinelandii CA6]WKN19837.1 DUF4150 domain-containing protein [Azotobacter vinelandii]SFX31755.1 protein of unknown function [Azotobacter vinelandii]
MFMNTQQKGKCLAVGDLCKTPPTAAPVPYVNQAEAMMSIPGCYHVLVQGMPAHNMRTITPITTGDSAGAMGGVVSNTVMAQSRYVAGSYSVLLQGMPTTRLTSPTLQNNNNIAGLRVTPSQNIVLITAP